MYFSIKEVKTKRFDRSIEKVFAGDPMPEATRFKKPEVWARWVEPGTTEYKANISTWERRTGRKVDELFETLKAKVVATPDASDFSDNAEFKEASKDDILTELSVMKEGDQPDLKFDALSSKEVLFEILLDARSVVV